MTFQTQYAINEPSRSVMDASEGLVLLEFGAPWCGHCVAAQLAIRTLLHERGGLRHLKIEDGRGKPLGRSFAVKLWPTLILLRDGEEVARVVRPQSVNDLVTLQCAMPVE